MFLMNLVKVDFGLIFNQGFRLLLVMTSLLCYTLLIIFHAFMLRPLYKICGKAYFSVISRWIFRETIDSPPAASYNEIAVVCYITNIQDMTVMSFGLLFIGMFMCECCLRARKKRQLHELLKHRSSLKEDESRRLSGESRRFSFGGGGGKPDTKILRQRLSKKSSTTRFIGRLALLLPSAFLSTVHFLCAIITYLLIYLVAPSLDSATRQANITYIDAVKWRTLIYTILSFFMCGFYWSMSGIDMSLLKAIYARSRRQDQFRRMNASVFTEGNTIIA